jgi:hypothetical protein
MVPHITQPLRPHPAPRHSSLGTVDGNWGWCPSYRNHGPEHRFTSSKALVGLGIWFELSVWFELWI